MLKSKRLQKGEVVAIVSLSSGTLGESYAAHQLELGEKRLRALGLDVVYTPNSRKGTRFLSAHPEARAADLKTAFQDDSIKGIICAIGGDDTYRTLPYLLDDPEFVAVVKNNPKIFVGFSDTTINHLMFYKLGLQTYYGPAFLTDFAELAQDMLPYTKAWVDELLYPTENKEIASSPVWYEERQEFGPSQLGINRVVHEEKYGYDVLHGSGIIQGRLLGGCLESMVDLIAGGQSGGEVEIGEKYQIFPSTEEWQDKILFVEMSETKPSLEKSYEMLRALDSRGVFGVVSGVLVGKEQVEDVHEDLRHVWLEIAERYNLPILSNVNFGHATPRCILPYGGLVRVDLNDKRVFLEEPLVA